MTITFLMLGSLGILLRLHGGDELFKKIATILGPRAGLGMVLDGEDRQLAVADALHGAVVQVDVRDLDARGLQPRGIDRVAVVLRGDVDPAGAQVLHRMVAAAVSERQLERARPEGAADDLVAEADPED